LDVVTVSKNQDKQVQIFISYALDDDAIPPDAPGAKGFVTALHAYLEYAFQYHGYPRPSVWRGTRNVENGEELDPVVKEAIDASSLLLIVLSRNWPHRLYCRRELEFFRQRWQADGDNIRHRIIVARKHYVEESEHPKLFDTTTGLIPRQTGFDFFKFDGRKEPGKERLYFDPQKRPQDSDYVQKASELGRHLWLVARNCMQKDNSQVVAAAQESRTRPQVPRNGRTIYLAKPAPDMLQAYRRVERELYEAGFDVVPKENQEIPPDQSAEGFIDGALKAAEVSVHLVGSDLAIAPTHHDRIVRLQLERAAEKVKARTNERTGSATSFHRIIWAPKFVSMEFRDPFEGFAKFRVQVDGDKVIESDISRFEDFLRDHLGRNTPEIGTPRGSEDTGPTGEKEDTRPTGEKKIYLYHSEEDSEYAADLAMALQELENLQIEPLLPALEGPPPEVESYHRQRLAECDAIVLCWANASEVWIRAHAHQLRDWRGLGRTERFAFRGLIAGPPPGNRKKILLRVPPRSEIDKVLDLTEQAPALPAILNDWFIRAPPNNS
jgi:hypothetical protein